MACLNPSTVFIDRRSEPAKVYFVGSASVPKLWYVALPDGVSSSTVPCGKCRLCHQRRAFDIMVRAVAEARLYDFSSFITLTCSDSYMPSVFPNGKLLKRPYQLFLKRLRKRIGSFRYLLCGEYGSRTGRPHYHLIVFGHRFVDGFVRGGCWVDSSVISSCWPYGLIKVDSVNDNRIAYVAGYQVKGSVDDEEFPQFVVWSRRPGLGSIWFDRYWSDMVRNGFTFSLGGRNVHVSARYFFNRLRLLSPVDYDKLVLSRQQTVDDGTVIMRHEKALRHVACLEERDKKRKVDSAL